MNRFAVSLIWIIITAAACYGVIIGYQSLNAKPVVVNSKNSNMLNQNLTQTLLEKKEATQIPEPTTEEIVKDSIITNEFTQRVTALSQVDFDRLTRRLDDLITASVTIKKGSMGKRVSEFKEILNIVTNKNLIITSEADNDMISQVNFIKNYFKLPEDSLADKALYTALKKLLLDARNS